MEAGASSFRSRLRMNSEENRQQLARACGKYLLATRMGSVKEIKKTVLSHSGRYKVIRDNLHAKEVIVGDGERRRRYILCYNPKEAEKQRKHREGVVQELEEHSRSIQTIMPLHNGPSSYWPQADINAI